MAGGVAGVHIRKLGPTKNPKINKQGAGEGGGAIICNWRVPILT